MPRYKTDAPVCTEKLQIVGYRKALIGTYKLKPLCVHPLTPGQRTLTNRITSTHTHSGDWLRINNETKFVAIFKFSRAQLYLWISNVFNKNPRTIP